MYGVHVCVCGMFSVCMHGVYCAICMCGVYSMCVYVVSVYACVYCQGVECVGVCVYVYMLAIHSVLSNTLHRYKLHTHMFAIS